MLDEGQSKTYKGRVLMIRDYIVFGAGHNGRETLKYLGASRVKFFCDNNPEKVGTTIEGIEVISFEKLCEIHRDYCIIMAVADRGILRKQFRCNGITNYIEYIEDVLTAGGVMTHAKDIDRYNQSKVNAFLEQYIKKSNEIDPINDFESFRKLVKQYKADMKGEYAFNETYFGESILYGHGKALMRYAGISEEDFRNFPIVWHGISYCGSHPESKSAVIGGNLYDKRIHNQNAPGIPFFAVGPYIHYAKSIYSKGQMEELKKKNGKTALIFLSHGAEKSYSLFDETEVINNIIGEYKQKYDTVMVSAYWHDVDKEIYEILNKKGIKIVSSGFRFDENFINRQKTIFELADEVIVHGFTSAVIYALYMKKEMQVYPLKNEVVGATNTPQFYKTVITEETEEFQNYCHILYERLGNKKGRFTEEEVKELNLHFGFDQIKTPEEIRMIYEISKKIWMNCSEDLLYYPIGVEKTCLEYQITHQFDKLQILLHAIGKMDG